MQYFKTHDHSPITNELFKNKDLQRNSTVEGILKTFILQSPTPSSSTPTYYKVHSGDTLIKIAEQKGFDLDQMKAANPELKESDQLAPNQVIKLPRKRGERFSRERLCSVFWHHLTSGLIICARQ